MRTFKLTREELRVKIKQVMDEEGLTGAVDETSHFILRLSYCQTEDLRRWFLTHECELLRIRLQLLSSEQLAQLVQTYLSIQPINEDRKQELSPHLLLMKGSNGSVMSAQEFHRSRFFAVPFTQALDLVARRECYLEGGQAFISQNKVEAILIAKFRTQLSRELAALQSHAPLDTTLQHDAEGSRVYPLLKNLSHCLVHKEKSSTDYAGNGQSLTAATLPSLVPQMPLCMQEMHKGMKRHGKLRHFGRLQYGLFLKGAGLDMDNAILFFQRHFTAVTGEQFQKEYAYNIRYNYGKEGKRQSRDPYSCNGIINGNAPGNRGDFHGCPYKHYDADHLSSLLGDLSLQDRKEVLALKKAGHYGLACHKQFVAKHPKALEMSSEQVPLDNLGNHPNAWFRASRAYHAAMEGESGAVSTSSPVGKGLSQSSAATVSPA